METQQEGLNAHQQMEIVNSLQNVIIYESTNIPSVISSVSLLIVNVENP